MTLLTSTEELVRLRREWVEQAELALERTRALPETLQVLPGKADVEYGGNYLALEIYNGRESLHVLAQEGAIFSAAVLSKTFGTWSRSGRLGNIELTVYDVEPPETCKVVAKRVTVTQYESECKEDVK